MVKNLFSLVTILVVTLSISSAAADAVEGQKRIKVTAITGSEAGQFVKGRYWQETYRHLWTGTSFLGVGMNASLTERISMNLECGGRIWYNTFPAKKVLEVNAGFDKYADIVLEEARGKFSVVSTDKLLLDISLGYFPYKYNPDVTDLGEYLFRTGTYPLYFLNYFDYPKAKLSGALLHAAYSGKWLEIRLDQIFNMETEMRPFHDLSIATVGAINLFKAIELGGGINFARAISVDKGLTSPEDPFTQYVTTDGDTGYYSFSGIKPMLRASCDPLFFLRKSDLAVKILGQGGKLYSEVAWIGTKNFPVSEMFNPYGYDKLNDRKPWMFGVTIPVPFVLDVCALEFEYCSVPYPLDYGEVFKNGWPLPGKKPQPDDNYNPETFEKDDNWKFSLYARKQIARCFTLTGQIARNHQKYRAHMSQVRNYDFGDVTLKPDEWLWNLKLEFRY